MPDAKPGTRALTVLAAVAVTLALTAASCRPRSPGPRVVDAAPAGFAEGIPPVRVLLVAHASEAFFSIDAKAGDPDPTWDVQFVSEGT